MGEHEAAADMSSRRALNRRESATNAGLGVAMVAAVPFFVTGLFRLGLSTIAVFAVCLGAAGGLLAIPKRGPWMAIGWLIGCALYAVALVAFFAMFADSLVPQD